MMDDNESENETADTERPLQVQINYHNTETNLMRLHSWICSICQVSKKANIISHCSLFATKIKYDNDDKQIQWNWIIMKRPHFRCKWINVKERISLFFVVKYFS